MLDLPHVLINSHLRCGGSLLARLLDGHPQLMVFPGEMRYSRHKTRWPALDGLAEQRDFAGVVDEMDLGRRLLTEVFASEGRNPKDGYGEGKVEFRYDEFLRGVEEELERAENWDLRTAVNAVMDSFFQHWDQGKHYGDRDSQYFVNHMSMMCFSDPSDYFEAYPDGFIVQTIREPKAWYASMKLHFKAGDDAREFMSLSLLLWFESIARALLNSKQSPDRYLLIRYEDIVRDPRDALNGMVETLGLEPNPILFEPTLGGRPWLGNSAYGAKESVDSESLHRWSEVLTAEEMGYITDNYTEAALALGYDKDRLTSFPAGLDQLSEGALGLRVDLSAADDRNRLAGESERMAAILYGVHRGFVLMYRKAAQKNGLSRLKGRLVKAVRMVV